MRRFAASYWTVAAAALVIVVLHAWWLSSSDHAGEVLSGLGAAFTALGIWLAARPFIRNGLKPAIGNAQPRNPGMFPRNAASIREHRERLEREMPAIILDVWAERVVAVGVVVVGTLLNGYGTPIARVFGMRI